MQKRYLALVAIVLLVLGCGRETRLVPDNQPPDYSGVPLVKIRNYVNRIFIDLIGREPNAQELNQHSEALKAAGLALDARRLLIQRLMFGEATIPADSVYAMAYAQRLFELGKGLFLEGASLPEIQQFLGIAQQNYLSDSLSGDAAATEASRRRVRQLERLLLLPQRFFEREIGFWEALPLFIDNDVYDFINMNSFNFVRSCFNDLFNRFPTQAEFQAGYTMVEFSQPAMLFGQAGASRSDFVRIVCTGTESEEGLLRWMFRTLMAREMSTQELFSAWQQFHLTKNLSEFQMQCMISDEYAGF